MLKIIEPEKKEKNLLIKVSDLPRGEIARIVSSNLKTPIGDIVYSTDVGIILIKSTNDDRSISHVKIVNDVWLDSKCIILDATLILENIK